MSLFFIGWKEECVGGKSNHWIIVNRWSKLILFVFLVDWPDTDLTPHSSFISLILSLLRIFRHFQIYNFFSIISLRIFILGFFSQNFITLKTPILIHFRLFLLLHRIHLIILYDSFHFLDLQIKYFLIISLLCVAQVEESKDWRRTREGRTGCQHDRWRPDGEGDEGSSKLDDEEGR